MKINRGRGQFSLVFASFFGAAMIAAAFAYSNYRYSEYKFIDFSNLMFYTKKDIFTQTSEKYTVVIYSSNMQDFNTILDKISKENPILVIDMFQQKRGKEDEVLYIASGMNTILKVVQRFNVYDLPSAFRIKRFKDMNYKQDSLIEVVQ
jgi:predicted MPP superfamily phosphohydrolase